MKDQRPVNLNLFTIRMPLPAIASILHRISGFLLFFSIPFILWALKLSLSTQENFDDLHHLFLSPFAKFLGWFVLSAFIYHFIAGIRHLLMDVNLGVELRSGRISAILTLLLAIILIILAGVWIW